MSDQPNLDSAKVGTNDELNVERTEEEKKLEEEKERERESEIMKQIELNTNALNDIK